MSSMGKKRKNKMNSAKAAETCLLCQRQDVDEFHLGAMLSSEGISCHYHCLLFACGLKQGGEDEDGILGFLVDDIRAEARRGNRLNCRFCKKKGATSACAIAKCQVKFHVPCGIKHNILNQFMENFNSYCPTHRPAQNIPLKFRSSTTDCTICYETISPVHPYYKELWTPCCKKWLHKDCIQRQAYSAGHFYFKCPLCNNDTTFKNEMIRFGIYAPEKDASWETVPNAFAELESRYERCDAENCLCPNGRNFDEDDNNNWTIVVCELCASQGIHIKCGNVKEDQLQTWACNTCFQVKKRKMAEEESNSKRFRTLHSSEISDDENIDTTNVNRHCHEIDTYSFVSNESDSIDAEVKPIDLTFKNISDECKNICVKFEDKKLPIITID